MTLVRDLRRAAVARAERDRGRRRPVEHCDLCDGEVPADHRHLLQLAERQILCACESCFALRSGDPELRPTGHRIVPLARLSACRTSSGPRFRIPIGLAFLFGARSRASSPPSIPSPAGATESELDLEAWEELVAANPILETLELGRRGADRQPPRRPTSVPDRADRPLLCARRARQAPLGRDQRRLEPPRGDRTASRHASKRRRHDRARREQRPRRSSRSRASRRTRTRPRRCCVSPSRRRHERTRDLHDRSGAQVQIDADRRAYDPETRVRLHDLFGEPEQIPQTAGQLQIGRVETLVPSFRGAGSSRSPFRSAATSSSRRRGTSPRSTAVSCRSASTSMGRSSTAARPTASR